MITFIENIVIRKMRDEEQEYRLMTKWLRDDEVLKFYQGRDKPSTIDEVIEKYGPRARGEDRVSSCFIEFDNSSIGYIQYYTIDKDEKLEYSYEEKELIYGIDLFIGEIQYQNKGIGKKVIMSLVNYLKVNKNADKTIIDPRVDNERAIVCYEKCGFKIKKLLPRHELHEGVYCDNLLMEK